MKIFKKSTLNKNAKKKKTIQKNYFPWHLSWMCRLYLLTMWLSFPLLKPTSIKSFGK